MWSGGFVARQVFISYARKNKEEVALIREALDVLTWGAEITLWQDVRDIRAGDDWQSKLWTGLSGSDVVLVCLSQAYLASHWCRVECDEAMTSDAVVIPCVVEPCNHAATPVARLNLTNEGRAMTRAPDPAAANAVRPSIGLPCSGAVERALATVTVTIPCRAVANAMTKIAPSTGSWGTP